jgi:predicted NBD/HSP70 family sugar kinase
MNQSDVVRIASLIYSQGLASRAGLAEQTNLAPSYVGTIVKDLQQKGLVAEGDRAPSPRGRRRVLLHINPGLGELVGIRIGRANIRVVVTDFLGKVRTLKKLHVDVSKGQEYVLDLVHQQVKPLIRHDGAVKGIGVGISGVIGRKRGTVLFWPKVQGWHDVPLKQIFEDCYGLPTVVEDSVRAMALAECRFGQGGAYRDFAYVTIGVGIGAAVFVNGNFYFGADGLAGELGHTTIDERGEMCSCGNRGCVEVYASGWAIIDNVRRALQQGVTSTLLRPPDSHDEHLTIESIVDAARQGDRLSQNVLSEAGTHLGTALGTFVNLFNPQSIILSGAVPQVAKTFFLKSLSQALRHRAFHRSVRNLIVVVSRLGGESGAIGAALLVAEQLLRKFCISNYSDGVRA